VSGDMESFGLSHENGQYKDQSINQSINQSERPIVAELLLLGKVRNEKRKRKNGYEKLIASLQCLSSEYDIRDKTS